MLKVIRNHKRASEGKTRGYESLSINPVPLMSEDCPDQNLITAAKNAWAKALSLGENNGYRNA